MSAPVSHTEPPPVAADNKPKGRRAGMIAVSNSEDDGTIQIDRVLSEVRACLLTHTAEGLVRRAFAKPIGPGRLFIEVDGHKYTFGEYNDTVDRLTLDWDHLDLDSLPPDKRAALCAALQLTGTHPSDSALGSEFPYRAFDDIPLIRDCHPAPVTYLEWPILPHGGITAYTGDSGSGKSTLLSKLAYRVSQSGTPVLILDRDNSLIAVNERFERLNIRDGPSFRILGGWNPTGPPGLDSPYIQHLVESMEVKPLIVLDSLGAFFDGGDENDNAHMRQFLRPARHLTQMGATVALAHNGGKSENSRDYRGASAFKDGIDAAFHVSNSNPNGLLDKLIVKAFKHRFSFVGSVTYRYDGGKLERATENLEGATDTGLDVLAMVLQQNSGLNSRDLETACKERGISSRKCRQLVKAAIKAGKIVQSGGRGSKGLCHIWNPGVS